MKPLYDYQNYKRYLLDYFDSQPGKGRGLRSRAAESLGCRVAYLSQVLTGDADLSFEQAEAMNQFLGHSDDESDFFILLVHAGRAGSESLKKRLNRQIQNYLAKRHVLKDRVDIKQTLVLEAQAQYYSSWIFAAVHILTTIEGIQTKKAISEYLNLPVNRVADVLEFLESISLVKNDSGYYKPVAPRIFLGIDSPMLARHHANWRIRAIESLDRNFKDDLHLSSVVSLSASAVSQIKEQLIQSINVARSIGQKSKEEVMHCLCVDFFKV